jgi:geranylgeranyl diphosphate synthase type II
LSVTLGAYLEARRAEIEAALDASLNGTPDVPAVVAEAMRYSLTAGGKRLRPLLCLASAEAVGGDRRDAMPAACAIELIHTYSLIHDDLPAMDNDTLRRGLPTLHVVAGEGMAILAGDGLLTEAFALLSRSLASGSSREPGPAEAGHYVPNVASGFSVPNVASGFSRKEHAERVLRVINVIATAAGPAGMVGGQAIDLACVAADPSGRRAPALDAEGLRVMHAKKTGALIRASAAAGAILGGGSDAQVAAIDEAAAELGLAFQIVDDVLDVEGVSQALGKTAGKDAAAGKPTYPALYGLPRSREMAAECLARAEQTLAEAGLADSRLLEIGRWIVTRGN